MLSDNWDRDDVFASIINCKFYIAHSRIWRAYSREQNTLHFVFAIEPFKNSVSPNLISVLFFFFLFRIRSPVYFEYATRDVTDFQITRVISVVIRLIVISALHLCRIARK